VVKLYAEHPENRIHSLFLNAHPNVYAQTDCAIFEQKVFLPVDGGPSDLTQIFSHFVEYSQAQSPNKPQSFSDFNSVQELHLSYSYTTFEHSTNTMSIEGKMIFIFKLIFQA
jgi:hypothetical protein